MSQGGLPTAPSASQQRQPWSEQVNTGSYGGGVGKAWRRAGPGIVDAWAHSGRGGRRAASLSLFACSVAFPPRTHPCQEDAYLVSAVEKYGTQRWSQIARGLVGRSSKACSHRWRTYLQPGVKRTAQEPFSEWEIAVVAEVGTAWA